jgi:hypothetical protein
VLLVLGTPVLLHSPQLSALALGHIVEISQLPFILVYRLDPTVNDTKNLCGLVIRAPQGGKINFENFFEILFTSDQRSSRPMHT